MKAVRLGKVLILSREGKQGSFSSFGGTMVGNKTNVICLAYGSSMDKICGESSA